MNLHAFSGSPLSIMAAILGFKFKVPAAPSSSSSSSEGSSQDTTGSSQSTEGGGEPTSAVTAVGKTASVEENDVLDQYGRSAVWKPERSLFPVESFLCSFVQD